MTSKLQNRKQEGFTIIEVLIVLAIAGLIVLIVFLAVPALQRNSRNTQRKNDVSNVTGAMQEAINNGNGNLAVGATGPGTVTQTTRTQLATIDYNWVLGTTVPTFAAATSNPETVIIRNNLKCNGAFTDPGTNTTTIATTIGTTAADIATRNGATSRTAVVIYPIERQGGLTAVCQDI